MAEMAAALMAVYFKIGSPAAFWEVLAVRTIMVMVSRQRTVMAEIWRQR